MSCVISKNRYVSQVKVKGMKTTTLLYFKKFGQLFDNYLYHHHISLLYSHTQFFICTVTYISCFEGADIDRNEYLKTTILIVILIYIQILHIRIIYSQISLPKKDNHMLSYNISKSTQKITVPIEIFFVNYDLQKSYNQQCP